MDARSAERSASEWYRDPSLDLAAAQGGSKEHVAGSTSIQAAELAEESAEGAAFVPITLKASPVEIQLPNGGIVRLPLSVGQAVLVEVIRAAGALRPWKEPASR